MLLLTPQELEAITNVTIENIKTAASSRNVAEIHAGANRLEELKAASVASATAPVEAERAVAVARHKPVAAPRLPARPPAAKSLPRTSTRPVARTDMIDEKKEPFGSSSMPITPGLR